MMLYLTCKVDKPSKIIKGVFKMTKVINTRTSAEYELLGISDNGVKLKDLSTNKEKIITNEVYNKWYKVVEETKPEEIPEGIPEAEPVQEEEPVEEQPIEEPKEEKPVEEPTEEKPKKRGRAKKEKAPKEPKSKEPSILKSVLEKILKAAGCEIFITQVKGFHTVKVGGKMAMAYTFSTRGIVLWMRSKAIETLNIETKYMKHMFDRRLALYENNEETVELMRKIVAVSVEYQKGINQAKEEKLKARQEYLKEREAKREARKQKNMEAKFGVKQKKGKKVEEPVEQSVEE